ncbi:MAG: PAS domain S-box protein [Actinomycetota bacterium]|nr:PAS domain S-box protein [Actinomycetota bacterium]
MRTPEEAPLQLLPEAALQVDSYGRLVARNRLAAAMFGATGPLQASALTESLRQMPGFRDWLAGRGDEFFRGRLHARRSNGVPLTVDLSARRIAKRAGGAVCLLVELDGKRVSTEAQRYFDIAFDTAPIGMALFNTDGEFVRVNASLCTMLGRTEDELLGRRDQELTHPDDRQADIDAAWRILRGEIHTWQCEKRFVHADGGVVWAIANLTFLRDEAGNPLSWVGQFQDITARRTLETDLRERERLTRRILETAHDAFVSIDEAGVVVDWNSQAEVTFGWERDEIIGRELADTIVPEALRDGYRRGLQRFLTTGTSSLIGPLVELSGLHRSGREFPVELTICAVPTVDGYRFNAFLRDISGRRRVEEEVARAHSAAVEASRMKSEFLANMSHEIRTPLNGVIGMTGLLLQTDLDAEQRDFAETAKRSGEVLLDVVNGVLDLSKIEAAKLDLDSCDFDLRELADDVGRLLGPQARAKGLGLSVSVALEVPIRMTGDPGRVRQVITNLAGNAVKFTDAGDVAIDVSLAEAGDRPLVRVEVRDTGIGIPAADQDRLFESFTQAHASTTRRYGGTGLGLAISKRLAELMGGSIGLDSAPGRGSTFWFTVRLGVAGPPPPASVALVAQSGPIAPAGLRVLVAEDNPVNQRVASAMLARLGFGVDVVGGGAQAVEALRHGSYAAVLMDCQMPGMNGYESTAAIRREEGARHRTPIVAVTASAMKGDEERCLAAGMDAYLPKPVRMEALAEVLRRLLPDPSGTTTDEACDVDCDVLADLEDLSGDPALFEVFVTETSNRIEVLDRAVSIGDMGEAARSAHSVRGSAGAFGARGLGALSTELEVACRAGDRPAAIGLVAAIRSEFDGVRRLLAARPTRPSMGRTADARG